MASAIGFIAAGLRERLTPADLRLSDGFGHRLHCGAITDGVVTLGDPCSPMASAIGFIAAENCEPMPAALADSPMASAIGFIAAPRCLTSGTTSLAGLSDGFGHRLHCGTPRVALSGSSHSSPMASAIGFIAARRSARVVSSPVLPSLRWLRPSASLRQLGQRQRRFADVTLRWLRPSASLRPLRLSPQGHHLLALRWLRPSASLRLTCAGPSLA